MAKSRAPEQHPAATVDKSAAIRTRIRLLLNAGYLKHEIAAKLKVELTLVSEVKRELQ